MTQALHNWIWGLTSAGLLSAFALAFCGESGEAKTVRFACSLLMLSALLGPLQDISWEEYALALRENEQLASELTDRLERQGETLERLYIERECEAYILDEAGKLGMQGRVEVRARWKDNAFLPWEVTLMLSESEGRSTLSARIEAALGIPRERQLWQ
ncbi:MAG: hypothetical protein KBS46_02320 [Clostridiales bacterium]|nr:hypothetical protein [Candidatus Apopatocola equi]